MKSRNLVCISIVILFTSCKTQEDIRREKTMENINEKISQSQQNSANTNMRFQTLEEQLAKLNGSIEELAHNKGADEKEVLLLKEKVNQQDEINKKQNEYIKQLAEKLNEQTKYIEQVVKTLAEINDHKSQDEVVKKKLQATKEDQNEYKPGKDITVKMAINKFKEGNFDESYSILNELLESKKIKKKEKGAALYYLGMIELRQKKYEDAKIHFSKLFTELPESTYSAPALLNLAKTFGLLKSKEEEIQALEELISRFPKSKEAIEAQKIKDKM